MAEPSPMKRFYALFAVIAAAGVGFLLWQMNKSSSSVGRRFETLIALSRMFDALFRQHGMLLCVFSGQLAADVFLHLP